MYLWLNTPIAARLCAIHSTRGHCMEVGVGHKRSLYGGGGGAQEVTAWRWGWGLVQCHKTAETGKRNSISKQVATS